VVSNTGRWSRSARCGALARLVAAVYMCLIVLICVSARANASPAQSDVGATNTYLRAAEVFAHAQEMNMGASATAMEKQVTGIVSGCPSVLVGAPKGSQFSVLTGEIASTVLFSFITPDRTAISAFTGRVENLHWSNRKIAKLVKSVIAEERAAAKLVLPDVCADLSEWKASGYQTLSLSTMSFVKGAEAVSKETTGASDKEESPEEILLRRLRPRETPSERQMAQLITQFNKTARKRLLSVYSVALSHIGKALGIESS
jgi:hypothetical protein